jgi:translocation and assembly module TamB
VLRTSWFQQALERRIIAGLESFTGCHVEIGQFRFRPLAFQLVFHDFTLHGSELPAEAPLFRARTVEVRLSRSRLLQRQIRLREIDWDYADLHIRVRKDGSTNLPELGFPRDVALNEILDLAIGRLTLAHTTVYWNDRRLPLDLEAQNLAILLWQGHGRGYVGSLASSALSLNSPQWAPAPLSLTSRFELTGKELEVNSLAWQSQSVSGHGELTIRIAPAPEVIFALNAEASLPALGRTLRLPVLESGHLRLEGQGLYRKGEVYAQGRVEAREVLLRKGSSSSGRFGASGHFAVEHGNIELPDLAASGWGGSAQARLEIAMRDAAPHFRLRARLRGLDLATVLRSASPSPMLISYLHPASRIDGVVNAAWTGSFQDLSSDFGLELRSPDPPRDGAAPDPALPVSGIIQGAVNLNEGLTFTIQNADLRFPHSTFKAQGVMAEPPPRQRPAEPALPSAPASKPASAGRLKIAWTTSDFEEWRAAAEILAGASRPIPLSLDSQAVFSGELTGTLNAPQIRGRVEIGGFTFNRWTWNKLTADVVASPDYMEITSGRVERGTSFLSLDASAHTADWRVAPDSLVNLVARADHTPLDSLKAAVGTAVPLSGFISGRVSLQGTPSLLTGEGSLRIDKGEVSGEPFDSLTTQLHITQGAWNFDDIHLVKGHGTMIGQASFEPSRQSYSGQFKGTGFSLAEFKHPTLHALPSVTASPLDGQASFELSGKGTRGQFQVHSTCSIRNISVGGRPLGDFHGELDSQAQQLHFQGEATGAGGTIQISGETRPERDWPVNLAGQFADLRVDPWIRLLLDSRFSAGVAAGGSFRLAGALQNPDTLELQGRAQLLEVDFPASQWKNDQPVEFHYASNLLVAERFRMRGPSTDLEVGGSMRLSEPAALSFDAQGVADAAALSLNDPALQATGKAGLKMHISGTPSRPLLSGNVDIQDVNLRYGDMPFQLSGLNGNVQLEGERAIVTSLRGTSGGGTVALSGTVTLGETPRFDLSADLDRARVRYPADFTSVLNGSLRLDGTPDRALLHGDLIVRQVLFNENVNWLPRLIEANNPLTEKPMGVASPLASRIGVDVRVSSSPPVRIESQDLHLVADVDLRLQGTLADPVEVGTIHLTKGDAVFRGNQYKLSRGDITYANPFRTQPVLDLEARTRVQQYDLTLGISGPFDRLKLAYRSDPPLPTGDILSLLALGYAEQYGGREETMSVTTAPHASTSVGASALLSEALSSQVTGRIQRLFGVARIKIDPNVGTPGYGSGARVTFEEQVSRDFTVTYVTNTAYSQYRIIQVEWALSDKVSLLGVRDQNGVFGLEFKFRQRFK